MENERKKQLQETLKKFNKDHKAEIFSMGDEIEELAVIPTGVEAIDKFIGGGFKHGGHTIIWGAYSVGKTALILTAIANAQRQGKLVCYVNTEKPIDPSRFEFFGIDLKEMVYIEAPENAEQALEAMRTLCKGKVIDLFIIDSLNGLCPKSSEEDKEGKERSLEKKDVAALALVLSNFYNKVNAHVFRSRAAVVWIGQARTKGIGGYFVHQGLSGGNAQEFYAYQIIAMRKDQKANNPVSKYKEYFVDPEGKIRFATKNEEIGFGIVMKLEKTNSSKSVQQNKELVVPYYSKTGFKEQVLSEEVPIRIDPTMSEANVKKIEEFLKEKGLKVDQRIELTESTDWKPTDSEYIDITEVKPEDIVTLSGNGVKELKEAGFSVESIKSVDKGLTDAKEGKIVDLPKKRGRKPGSKNKAKEKK